MVFLYASQYVIGFGRQFSEFSQVRSTANSPVSLLDDFVMLLSSIKSP